MHAVKLEDGIIKVLSCNGVYMEMTPSEAMALSDDLEASASQAYAKGVALKMIESAGDHGEHRRNIYRSIPPRFRNVEALLKDELDAGQVRKSIIKNKHGPKSVLFFMV